MAVQVPSETLPEPDKGLDPHFVAGVFVRQYYEILEKSPEIVHKFYTDQSIIDRQGPDGEMTSVMTMQDINETIMSSDYKGCLAEILNVDSQKSLNGGIFIAVNGYFMGNDSLRKRFYQSFFLAKQEKGFFVSNDIMRFLDARETLTPPANVETEKYTLTVVLPTDTQESEDFLGTVDTPAQPEPINECEVEDDTKKLPDVKDTHSSDAPIQNEVTSTKASYASMVTKLIKVTSPTPPASLAVSVAQTADQQPKSSPILKNPPIVPSDTPATKDLNSSNNSTEHNSSNGDDVALKSVYIGNLPPSLTKSELQEAVEVFGRVREGSVQIRVFEDGFCFGFVEFESSSSAQNAVQVRNIIIGEKNSYLQYKRSAGRSSNNNGGYRGGPESGGDGGSRQYYKKHSDIDVYSRPRYGGGRDSYNDRGSRNYKRIDERRFNGGEAVYRQRRDAKLMNEGGGEGNEEGGGYQRYYQRRLVIR